MHCASVSVLSSLSFFPKFMSHYFSPSELLRQIVHPSSAVFHHASNAANSVSNLCRRSRCRAASADSTAASPPSPLSNHAAAPAAIVSDLLSTHPGTQPTPRWSRRLHRYAALHCRRLRTRATLFFLSFHRIKISPKSNVQHQRPSSLNKTRSPAYPSLLFARSSPVLLNCCSGLIFIAAATGHAQAAPSPPCVVKIPPLIAFILCPLRLFA